MHANVGYLKTEAVDYEIQIVFLSRIRFRRRFGRLLYREATGCHHAWA